VFCKYNTFEIIWQNILPLLQIRQLRNKVDKFTYFIAICQV